jgi:Cu+-exporting ATPase
MENQNEASHSQAHSCCAPKSKDASTRLVTDAVCGMKIDPLTAKGGETSFEGHDYFFCSSKCKAKFDLEPHAYLHEASQPVAVNTAT